MIVAIPLGLDLLAAVITAAPVVYTGAKTIDKIMDAKKKAEQDKKKKKQ